MKRSYIYTLSAIVLLSLCLSGCARKTNKQLFDEYYDVNVSRCKGVLVENGVDPTEAQNRCACMMNSLFESDSTFVRMNKQELQEFYKQYQQQAVDHCNAVFAVEVGNEISFEKE